MKITTVIRNERTEDHEGRDGRIRSRAVLTWDVVRDGELLHECRTMKEAKEKARKYNDAESVGQPRRIITAVRYPR